MGEKFTRGTSLDERKRIAELVRQGVGPTQIARALGRSCGTVQHHIRKIKSALGIVVPTRRPPKPTLKAKKKYRRQIERIPPRLSDDNWSFLDDQAEMRGYSSADALLERVVWILRSESCLLENILDDDGGAPRSAPTPTAASAPARRVLPSGPMLVANL